MTVRRASQTIGATRAATYGLAAMFITVLGMLLSMAAAQPANAQGMAYFQQTYANSGGEVSPPSTDRSFIREWEANPPKGFATLSKSNIEPTKAAIKLYSEIVARGAGRPFPSSRCRPARTMLVSRSCALGWRPRATSRVRMTAPPSSITSWRKP